MRHFMCDLETRGTIAGCAIVSIGVIGFNPSAATVDDLFEDFGFYKVVNADSCIDAYLHIEEGTDAWWKKQSPEAQKAWELHKSNDGVDLEEALNEMVNYVGAAASVPTSKALFYGNGADFDNPIAMVAARQAGVKLPWQWGNRCYRTLKNLDELFGVSFAAPKVARSGTYHNALDDAKTQAMHLWETVRNIKIAAGILV